MFNPKTAGIDEIHLEAENLNVLIELILSNKDLVTYQRDSLLGMALNASENLLH
ncbi:hypothetical protein [Kluyvera intermedia]|uniref:hypothetical protein n=1 Tax=Kluyvera intermedia TaxID=61648 RepID=UPI00370C8C51